MFELTIEYTVIKATSFYYREHCIQLVEAHCGKYMEMFGECIRQHPYTWQMDCDAERRKLAKCSETKLVD